MHVIASYPISSQGHFLHKTVLLYNTHVVGEGEGGLLKQNRGVQSLNGSFHWAVHHWFCCCGPISLPVLGISLPFLSQAIPGRQEGNATQPAGTWSSQRWSHIFPCVHTSQRSGTPSDKWCLHRLNTWVTCWKAEAPTATPLPSEPRAARDSL